MRVIAGRYRLLVPLGSGGMGRVWRAHDQQLGVDVAVKEVFRRPGIPDDHWNELLVRAKREARHGARLRDHANIVAVFDVVIEDGIPWTVMRLVKGTSLEARLGRGRLSADETAKVAVAVLGALRAAHEAGIIHRDVKPANIMLADDGGILLTDFGIAVSEVDTKLTQDGGIIGSMAYIAPERADGEQGSEASDLFSLGVTLYEATEGKSPFQRDTLTATLRAVAVHEPPPPAHAGHLTALITALLRKEPGARPTVAEALAMMRPDMATVPKKQKKTSPSFAQKPTITSGRGTATKPAGKNGSTRAESPAAQMMPHSGPEQPAGRSLWVKIVAGIVTVTAAATAGFLVYERSRPGPPEPHAKDLLQQIQVARFLGVQTSELTESDSDPANWQGKAGPRGGDSEHEWGDGPDYRAFNGWGLLVDVYHYSSADEASMNSTTFIAEDQHSSATIPGYSYHAVTAPPGMTAVATTAYHAKGLPTYTEQDLEIVDGAYRIHLETRQDDASGRPRQDVSQLAKLIFPRMPAPPGKAK
ncbi:serine/threonine-protein kinase [Streptomyces sp. NPDC020917]|uniref:serine/threonine-protein kinase n=1 Tax=Streptomyces sp. NPDC020917 TaxID=3365102 RepID=UPI0037941D1C